MIRRTLLVRRASSRFPRHKLRMHLLQNQTSSQEYFRWGLESRGLMKMARIDLRRDMQKYVERERETCGGYENRYIDRGLWTFEIPVVIIAFLYGECYG